MPGPHGEEGAGQDLRRESREGRTGHEDYKRSARGRITRCTCGQSEGVRVAQRLEAQVSSAL